MYMCVCVCVCVCVCASYSNTSKDTPKQAQIITHTDLVVVKAGGHVFQGRAHNGQTLYSTL